MTDEGKPREVGSHAGLGPTLDAWAESAGVQFVSRSYGQYTTGTVSRDALETLLANALHAGIEHGRTQAAKVLPALPKPRLLASGNIAGKRIELHGWHTDDIESWQRQHGVTFGA